MKPAYRTLRWLDYCSTRTALHMSEQEIKEKTIQVDKADLDNRQLYTDSILDQDRKRLAFRNVYPRKEFPPELKYRPSPPMDLKAQWDSILRRAATKRRQDERQKEERRDNFIDRMYKGRYKAMRRRERSTRRIIREQALLHGIELTERATDARLRELFAALYPVPAKNVDE